MRKIVCLITVILSLALFPFVTANADSGSYFFNYNLDGKPISLSQDDVSTSYNVFSATDKEFKIFAGKSEGPQLLLTIPQDMTKPSSTASGSPEAGNKIFQGSVSLQDYPEKGLGFSNYDGFADPKPAVFSDAIVITGSEVASDGTQIITGKINTQTLAGEDAASDPRQKPHTIVGEFRIKATL